MPLTPKRRCPHCSRIAYIAKPRVCGRKLKRVGREGEGVSGNFTVKEKRWELRLLSWVDAPPISTLLTTTKLAASRPKGEGVGEGS